MQPEYRDSFLRVEEVEGGDQSSANLLKPHGHTGIRIPHKKTCTKTQQVVQVNVMFDQEN